MDIILARLEPDCEIDVRGTRIGGYLLRRLLDRVAKDGVPSLTDANFIEAQFNDDVDFGRTIFRGITRFSGAEFRRVVHFDETQFLGGTVDFREANLGRATFRRAVFRTRVDFSIVELHAGADFAEARFHGPVDFHDMSLTPVPGEQHILDFTGAEFSAPVNFVDAWCRGGSGVDFSDATFCSRGRLGPLAADFVRMDRATFRNAVTVEALATELSCVQATFEAGATIRVRYAALDLEQASFAAASTVVGSEPNADRSFDSLLGSLGDLDNGKLANRVRDDRQDRRPRPADVHWFPALVSLQGVDVTELNLVDIDLSRTRFVGAHYLDKLRIEGRSRFVDPGHRLARFRSLRIRWAWPPYWGWTRRQLLAEEVLWRATRPSGSHWRELAERLCLVYRAPEPETLAGLYRSLRKAQEDSKNEPGAADFYYGEMEMRRRAPSTSLGERIILSLYWLSSGYGLRAVRALSCLVTLVVVVTIGMRNLGFVGTHPDLRTTLLYVVDAVFSVDPKLAGTDVLTRLGELQRLLIRVSGPLLLGLAILSVRNRIKR